MNIFKVLAMEAGKAFILENPNATGSEIDDAATAHSPLDPTRRHFQDGAYWTQDLYQQANKLK